MRADFYRPDSPDQVVGTASWDGSRVQVEAVDDEVKKALGHIFRATPVSVDDPSLRATGSAGPVVLFPGTLRWFQAAGRARAPAYGLGVRLVPERIDAAGWDPAGAYRPFSEVVERSERAPGRR